MSYTMEVKGLAEISKTLEKLGNESYGAASAALYDGAGVMAGEIGKGANNIRTAPFKYAGKGQKRLPSPEEKAVLTRVKSMGIARFRKRVDEVNTSVGYSKTGYAPMVGRMKPIPVIANAINSGTSFMQKQSFFRQAVTRGSPKAEEAIRKKLEARLDAITKRTGGNDT